MTVTDAPQRINHLAHWARNEGRNRTCWIAVRRGGRVFGCYGVQVVPGLDRCGDCAAGWRTGLARSHVLCMQIDWLPWLQDSLDLGLDV